MRNSYDAQSGSRDVTLKTDGDCPPPVPNEGAVHCWAEVVELAGLLLRHTEEVAGRGTPPSTKIECKRHEGLHAGFDERLVLLSHRFIAHLRYARTAISMVGCDVRLGPGVGCSHVQQEG